MARSFVASPLLPVIQDSECTPSGLPPISVPPNLVKVLKALADETRLQLLGQIARSHQPVCVCDLVDVAPVNQPTVSHHLKVLREAGVVSVERRGTWGYYSLAAGSAPIVHAALAGLLTHSAG